MRTADQAHRHRGSLDPLLLVLPAASGGGSEGRRGDPARDDRRSTASLADAGRTSMRGGQDWTAQSPRAPSAPGAPRRRGGRQLAGRGRRLMSILRLAGVTREIGTFTILDSIDAAIALGDRIGLVGPNGAGKTTLLRLAAGGDEPDRGTVQPQAQPVHRPAGPGGTPRRDVHGVAGPPVGGPPGRGPPRGDGHGARDARAGQPGRPSRPMPISSTATRSSAATPWTSASMPR